MKPIKKINYKPKAIRSFKSIKEEADFWDTHDLSGIFTNPKIALSKLPRLEKEKEAILTIRIQKSVKDKIERVARKKGINPTTLSRMWLIEKVTQALQ